MSIFKNSLVQFALVIMLGSSIGLAYRQHRSADQLWRATHYRLGEQASFPLAKGMPFEQQFFVDAAGKRVVVPLPSGDRLDYQGASWWQLDDSGEMHFWSEARDPVFPVQVVASRP